MEYVHKDRERWLEWYLDPSTTDEQQIRAALRSVPPGLEPWLFVEVRLRVGLHEAKVELLPPVSSDLPVRYRVYTKEDHRRWDLLELKERLFFEEVWRRREDLARKRS